MTNARETRSAFHGLIEKPVLTDELLARPPFRFILDIVSSTVTKTGYLRDRFPVDALNPSKFREKADKVAFLDSLIDAVNDGSLTAVKSSKIVAGKEAEQTNLLLIKLAEQAREFRDRKVDTPHEEPKEKPPPKTKHRSRSKDRKDVKEEKTKKHESKEEKPKKRSKSKDPKEKTTGEEKKVKTEKRKEVSEKKKKDVITNGIEDDKHRSKKKSEDSKRPSSRSSTKSKEKKSKEDMNEKIINNYQSTEITPQAMQHETISSYVNSSKDTIDVHSSERTEDSGVSDMTESPRQTIPDRITIARPHTSMERPGTASARPAPPKLKKKTIAVTEPIPPPVALIDDTLEKTDTLEDDFLVEEPEDIMPSNFSATRVLSPNEERGGLVKKMIETATDLKETNAKDVDDVDEGVLSKMKLQTDAFSNSLQTITRTTYPLSRIFDFAQEDLELMVKELERWRNDSKKSENIIMTNDAQGASDTHKLKTALASLDEDVTNMRSLVNASKARIASNNRRIQEMLDNI